MVIYIYILMLIYLKLILHKKRLKKLFVLISAIGLFCIAALRSIYFGPDVIRYVEKYNLLSYESFPNIITKRDPLFYLFSKFINSLGASPQVWLAILSGIFIISISILIYKYSDEPLISYVAIISLGYFYFSLTGLRQTMAISIILFSYRYLRERRLAKFIVWVILASFFHWSALIFIVAYPLANMKLGIKHFIGIITSFIISLFFGNFIRYVIQIIGWSERFEFYINRETSLTYSGFIIQLFIFIFCYIYRKKVISDDSNNIILYNILFCGLIFQAFAAVIAEIFRISMYFSIFSIILIPKSIRMEKNKSLKIIIYLLIFISLVFYIQWTGVFNDYKFFWNV